MARPVSNPLSLLRKLGSPLVGDDGLLTNAASVALGYDPMDRVKNRIAARNQAMSEAKFKTEQEGAVRRGRIEEQNLEASRFNLGRTQTLATREDAERAARGRAIDPDLAPDEAIGGLVGKQDLYKTQRANPMVRPNARLAELIGLDPNVEVDERQLQEAVTAFNASENRTARKEALHESQAQRNLTREQMGNNRRQSTYLDEQQRVVAQPVVRAAQQVISAAQMADGQLRDFEAAAKTGDRASANAILGEVMTVAFAKVRDPNSVVREGEVTRLLQQWGFADRAGNWLNKTINSGVLPVDALKRLKHAIDVDAETSYRYLSGEDARLEQVRRGQGGADEIPSYFRRDLTLGYRPRSQGNPDNDEFFK